MPSITITTPTAGSTVKRPFVARGEYVDDETPTISVVLKDSSGTVVATGNPVNVGSGLWDATLSPTQGYTDASVYAEIVGTSANATAGNITVS